jgi:hypothetical protein
MSLGMDLTEAEVGSREMILLYLCLLFFSLGWLLNLDAWSSSLRPMDLRMETQRVETCHTPLFITDTHFISLSFIFQL